MKPLRHRKRGTSLSMSLIRIEVNPNDAEEKEWLEAFINRIMILNENKTILSGTTLSIVFVSQEKIRRLNSNYRGIDEATDVLSFLYLDSDAEGIEENLLGEIIISKDYIKEQAEELCVLYTEELARMILHGFLHILGYTHSEDEDLKKMTDITEEYLIETRDIWMRS
jgi:probable rRNA maturation factor